jgi:hypothetical protein
MELFNKALFLSQQKIFALTHRRVYTLMVNLFQILNQFVLLFRKNVIDEGKDKGEGWEIRIKLLFLCLFLGIVTFVNCFGIVNRDPLKSVGQIKFYSVTYIVEI